MTGFTGQRVRLCSCCSCHSRLAGMAYLNHWIPACAGMTEGAGGRHSADMAKELSGWRQTLFRPLPLFQRRLESRKGGRDGQGMAGFTGQRVRL